jgi:hypothetical protein
MAALNYTVARYASVRWSDEPFPVLPDPWRRSSHDEIYNASVSNQ